MELEPADDSWPCVTLIDDIGNVVHEPPAGCEGLVEYPASRQGARLLYCTRYCEDVTELVRWRRRVEKEGRQKRAEDGKKILIALWRKESDMLKGNFYEAKLTEKQREQLFLAKGRRCVECGKAATDVDHIVGTGGNDPSNLQPLCRDCHLQKTAREGGMLVPIERRRAAESRRRLKAVLPRAVWDGAIAGGIPLFAVTDEPEVKRYVSYLCRVYATPPRLCDDEEDWKHVWRGIASLRRSELS